MSNRTRWSNATFLIGFGATLAALIWISSRYLVPLLLGLSAAVLLSGWNERLVGLLRGRRGLAALLMSVATFVVILGPLTVLLVLLIQAVIPFVGRISSTVTELSIPELVARFPDATALFEKLQLGSVEASLRNALAAVAGGLGAFVTKLPGRAAGVAFGGFITFLALFTFFATGPRLIQLLIDATPMDRRHTRQLIDAIAAGIETVFVASFLTALIQFVLGYIGFRIVSAPYPLALAAIMAFFSFIFSLIPVLGSGMVWGPLGAWLILTGRPIAGVFVLAWGLLVLGSVDNVVKPIYTKGKLQLAPLVVFVTLFGGIATLGAIGALLGPLIAAVAAAFLRIWTTDFLDD